MRHSLFIYLLITTLLGYCPIVGQTISPQEVIDRLYSPPDGQWLVSGRQVASKSQLWGKVDLERDSPDTIVNEEYSAIVITKRSLLEQRAVLHISKAGQYADRISAWKKTEFSNG